MTNKKSSGDKGNRKARTPSESGKQAEVSPEDLQTLATLIALARESRQREHIKPGTRLALTLSEDERRLILRNWSISGGLTDAQLRALEIAPRPELHLTLGDWDELAGWVAATSNHARGGSKLHVRACAFFDRIQELLDSYTDE